MLKPVIIISAFLLILSFKAKPVEFLNPGKPFLITHGSMPAKPLETSKGITIIFASGDSLLEVSVIAGKKMTTPSLIAVVPKMFSFAMRGPQAVNTGKGIVSIVCTENGDIYCYREDAKHQWNRSAQLNKPGTAKEGLMSLSADGEKLVAVWLNAREPKGQSIYAATSSDGGQTWSSKEIYTSPNGTTCECCKPSVIMKGNTVYVMFRNWINGNRDMHLMKSTDGGMNFTSPEKLGTGNWKLNGCPMDGGDIQIDSDGQPLTIWRREGKLYSTAGTGNETVLGNGKNGTIALVTNGNAYAWTDNGKVIVQTPDKIKHELGEGALPILTTLKNGTLLCIWQKDKSIMGSVINSAL